MLFRPSNLIAPHYCCSCGEIGSILCENCKYDIVSEPYSKCLHCGSPTSGGEAVCGGCALPFSRAWCIGEKNGGLEGLIDAHKFERAKAASPVFSQLLDATLPQLPDSVTVVPVPTVATHIRQRGYDHTLLLARSFAAMRSLQMKTPLRRRTNDTQRGASRREREEQAKRAFVCDTLGGGCYLLLDDVYTTGATVRYAAEALKAAGANEVWLAIVARQPLEK